MSLTISLAAPTYPLEEIFLVTISFILVSVLTWLIGRLLKLLLKKATWIQPDLRNGIFVLVTLSQFTIFILAVGSLLVFFNVRPEFIIGSLAIFVTAIGVAFTGVAANFIGGFYILITRPFKVGDLIRTQNIEGIVEEIGINYSRLMTLDRTPIKIPNGNLMNTALLNYIEEPTEVTNKIVPSSFFAPPKQFVIYKKMIELKLDILEPPIPMKAVKSRLDKVFTEYAEVFGKKPQYYFGKHDFRLELNIIIFAPDAYTIFNAWSYFMESIMTTVYQELQQENPI